MALYYDVRVDVSADNVLDSGYHFTQGDSRQIFLRIAVMNGTSRFDGSDAKRITINFRKADGNVVEGVPVLVGDVFQYQFLGNELQYPGRVIGDVKFEYDSGRISTGMFSFIVDLDTTNDNAVKSTTYVSTLEETRREANSILGEMNTSKDSIKGYSDAAEASANRALEYASGDMGSAKFYAEQAQEIADNLKEYSQDFKYIYIAYSPNEDGSAMTFEPQSNTRYVGFYTGPAKEQPIVSSDYTWTRMRGTDGDGSDWEEVANKPFNNLSDDFRVDNNNLKLSYELHGKIDSFDSKMDVPPSATEGQILMFNGANWIPGDVPSTEWSDIPSKPFETLGDNLTIVDGKLNVDIPTEKTWDTLDGKPFEKVSASHFRVDVDELKLSEATVLEISNATSGVANNKDNIDKNARDIAVLEAEADSILICDAYDYDKTYGLGDLCIANNTLYESKVATNRDKSVTNTEFWKPTTLNKVIKSQRDRMDSQLRSVHIQTGRTIKLKLSTYSTSLMLFVPSPTEACMYVFGNGYLQPIKTMTGLTMAMDSADRWQTIVITNSTAYGLNVGINVLTDNVTITQL